MVSAPIPRTFESNHSFPTTSTITHLVVVGVPQRPWKRCFSSTSTGLGKSCEARAGRQVDVSRRVEKWRNANIYWLVSIPEVAAVEVHLAVCLFFMVLCFMVVYSMVLCDTFHYFPFLSFPFLSFPFLSFPFLSFPFLSCRRLALPYYVSPCVTLSCLTFPCQVIKDAKGSEKADVYAFGILLWELATREEVGLVIVADAVPVVTSSLVSFLLVVRVAGHHLKRRDVEFCVSCVP